MYILCSTVRTCSVALEASDTYTVHHSESHRIMSSTNYDLTHYFMIQTIELKATCCVVRYYNVMWCRYAQARTAFENPCNILSRKTLSSIMFSPVHRHSRFEDV